MPTRRTLALVAAAMLAACGSPRSGASGSVRVENEAVSPIDPRFEAALDQVRAALDGEETEVARQILAGMLARRPEGLTLETVRRYVDIVDGRAIFEATDLELTVEADPDRPGGTLARLHVATTLRDEAALDVPPMIATRTVTSLDASGVERAATSTAVFDAAVGLVLPVEGDEREFVVAHADLPRGQVLAVREVWTLDCLAGHVVFEDRRLPLRSFRIEAPVKEWISSNIARSTIEPAEVGDFLSDPAAFEARGEAFTARLLERVLRVPKDRREELVAVLAESAEKLDDLARARLLPAVDWLLGCADDATAERWAQALASVVEPVNPLGAAVGGASGTPRDPSVTDR
ncbi:MAG: hypothetical protein R3F34_02940 [Planctomycetota bacterium]